ncbi:MAG: hypothetical protein WCG99_00420 [Candidatus Berkelbacteria bacterium]
MGNPEAGGQIGFEYNDPAPLPPSMSKAEPLKRELLPSEPVTYRTPEEARVAKAMKKLTGKEDAPNPYIDKF